MTEILLTKKQMKALKLLNDKETTELLYGGAAGGGKSFFGCLWIIVNCINYKSSRWMIGRSELKALKQSTLLTFFEICGLMGLKKDIDFKYNPIEGVIKFSNGSEVYLKDLSDQPSDPEFADLGSREYTGIFIDEANQISMKAYDICKSRIRYKLEEFDRIPKILICSNPYKNFLYFDFYKPWRDKKLPIYRKFLPAFVWENPNISPHYIENLKKADNITRERLLNGNWDYDVDEGNLFDYDSLCEMFNIWSAEDQNNFYVSCDVARFGEDWTVVLIWRGLNIVKVIAKQKTSTVEVASLLKNIMQEYQIGLKNLVVDEDGVGGGVVDQLGCLGFINNARPVELKRDNNPGQAYTLPPKHNFANLKTQCYFMLSDYIKAKRIGMNKDLNETIKEKIIEDLQQIRQKDIDKDGKITLEPKEVIKERLGRSTDFGDALMMRMFLQLRKNSQRGRFFI